MGEGRHGKGLEVSPKPPKSRNLMSKGGDECPKEENLVIRLLFDWIPQLESGPYTGDSDFYSVC